MNRWMSRPCLRASSRFSRSSGFIHRNPLFTDISLQRRARHASGCQEIHFRTHCILDFMKEIKVMAGILHRSHLLKLHQQIEIARPGIFSASHRTENREALHGMTSAWSGKDFFEFSQRHGLAISSGMGFRKVKPPRIARWRFIRRFLRLWPVRTMKLTGMKGIKGMGEAMVSKTFADRFFFMSSRFIPNMIRRIAS